MLNFFWKYCSVRTKKLHKMKLKKLFLILEKKIMIFKLELSPQNFHYDVLNPLYSRAAAKKNSQIPFWIGHPVTPTFEPLSSQGCHLYITLWHMWMHVNTRKTKTGCSKNTDASRPAANTLINLLRFYLIKNVMNWKPKSKRRQRSSQDIHT